jgi:hypothetical protein
LWWPFVFAACPKSYDSSVLSNILSLVPEPFISPFDDTRTTLHFLKPDTRFSSLSDNDTFHSNTIRVPVGNLSHAWLVELVTIVATLVAFFLVAIPAYRIATRPRLVLKKRVRFGDKNN